MIKQILPPVLLLVSIVVILILSGQSGNQAFEMTYRMAVPFAQILYKNPDLEEIKVVMQWIRLAGRVFAFAWFGGLLMYNACAIVLYWKIKHSKVWILMVFVLDVLFSIYDEAHKLFIEGRHCTLQEILLNILVSVAASVLVFLFFRKLCWDRRNLEWKD